MRKSATQIFGVKSELSYRVSNLEKNWKPIVWVFVKIGHDCLFV